MPYKILYNRDGVGDSEYEQVLQRELTQIEAAWTHVKAEFDAAGAANTAAATATASTTQPKTTAESSTMVARASVPQGTQFDGGKGKGKD